jgi:hypothetical protein
MTASATLPSLLWSVLGELERAFIDLGAGGVRMPSLDLWANLLRAIDETGVDCRELPAIVRLSKRALRSRVSLAARQGWIEESKLGQGRATVRLTVRGSDMAARWRLLQGPVEERWRARVGLHRTSKLRAALEELVAALPLEHPHYPASYGAADASITGGNGQDWRALRRGDGDTVSDLPLSALVSQALVAFAMNYEEMSTVALSLSTVVIKRIPAEGRPLQRLGDPVGVSALIRHGFVCVSGDNGSEIVHLTPKGRAVSSAYYHRIQAVETDWHKALGNVSVTALRRTLEAVSDSSVHTRKPDP